MISNEQINKILTETASAGYSLKVRDISYILLCREYEDYRIAYKSVFTSDTSTEEKEMIDYDKSRPISFLRRYMDSNYPSVGVSGKSKSGLESITFDENKAYMLKLKKDTEAAMEAGDIDKKDGLKILADISTKLNDKFQIADEAKEQMVVVEKKFNSICMCGREIYIPTKEDLMERYNLVEKE
jgi:hypothetical protein